MKRLILNGKELTPRQAELLLALLREEARLNRMGDANRATSILNKIGLEP